MERKSLKDISWQVTESVYRADSALSYSTLSRYEREGFNNLDKLFDRVESPSLTFGSCVDTLITGSEEEFNELFMVAQLDNSLSDTLVTITKVLFNKWKNGFTDLRDIPNDKLIDTIQDIPWNNHWLPATRAKKIKEDCAAYYKLLYLSEGKTIISTYTYQDVLNTVDRLKSAPSTRFYFEQNNIFDNNIERFYQLKFKGEHKGINIRCMFDLLLVDHERGIIVPVDLKTTNDVITFEDSFYKWRYFIQAQMYAEILKQNLDKDEYFRKFKILEYRFIAIDKYKLIPIVYKFEKTFGKVPLYYKGVWYRNWRIALEELNWHLEHPEIKLPYKMYIDYIKNNGVLSLEKYLNGYLDNDYIEPIVPEDEVKWKDVVGYEGYYKVSNTGRVVRLERKIWSTRNNSFSVLPERLLKLDASKSGSANAAYVSVTLTKDGESKKFFVHRLVAEAFIPNPNGYTVINHIDENPLNNNVDNLEWCTQEYNTNYGNRNTKVSIKLGEAVEQYDMEGNLLNTFRSAAEACRQLGLPPNRQSNISAVCRGIRKSSLGFVWKFVENE